jgi:hypothetical protein
MTMVAGQNITEELASEGISHNPYERVKDDDPRRCQSNNSRGQCQIAKAPGSDYCILHGGHRNNQKKQRLNNYRLDKWHQRVNEMANSDGIKSLRDEIGILRMVLEEQLNQIQDATQLIVMSHAISDLILKIEKVVFSCHRIEKSMGDLINRSDVVNLASQIIGILEAELADVQDDGRGRGGKELLQHIAIQIEQAVQIRQAEPVPEDS